MNEIRCTSVLVSAVLMLTGSALASEAQPSPDRAGAVQVVDLATSSSIETNLPQANTSFGSEGGSLSPGNVLYDNGLSFLNGLSCGTPDGVWRRALLDDFVVPEGEAWAISSFHTKGARVDGQGGGLDGYELQFYGDAGGQPDFDDLVVVAQNVTITQMNDPDDPDFFSLDVWDVRVDFDTIELLEGTYWVEMLAGIEILWFQVIGPYPQKRGAGCWVDYDDFGGRLPGFSVFSDDYDVNFVLSGEVRSPISQVSSFNVELGRHVGGTVFDLWSSDDNHLVIEQRLGISPLLPVIRVVVIGETQMENVSELNFTLEASATGLPPIIPQTTWMYNYEFGLFQIVDTGTATLSDSVRNIDITLNAEHFVQQDGQLRAQLNWFDPGGLFTASWSAKIDQAEWMIRP